MRYSCNLVFKILKIINFLFIMACEDCKMSPTIKQKNCPCGGFFCFKERETVGYEPAEKSE